MGIQNLLPFLGNSSRECHVSEFRGLSVAIDSYCWLHKGAIACAMQLAVGQKTDIHIQYCLRFIKMLLSYNIKPIMVFDGRRLPAKQKTEEKRREIRKKTRKQGAEMLILGEKEEAYKFFRQCIDITPEIALELIRECRKLNVDCIVAPYESDSQLAFFSMKNVVQCVISEDSDLLLFGCKKVLYKMDQSGQGQLVDAENINLSMKMKDDHFTMEKFRHMCILSGCDYLDNLPGIGIKKALKFLSLTAESNPKLFLDKIPQYLNKRDLNITQEYKENFLIADATFLHQTVFNPFTRKLERLNPVSTNPNYCCNAGDFFDNDLALQLALGNSNPNTMEKMDNWTPNQSLLGQDSIWSESYKPREPRRKSQSNIIQTPKRITRMITEVQKEDTDVEEMLEFYKKAAKQQEEMIEEEAKKEEPEITIETSPILNKNPFVKRRLSKFAVTEMNEKFVVRSRFFSNNDQSQSSCDNENEINQSENAFDQKGISSSDSNNVQSPSEMVDMNSQDENVNLDLKIEKTATSLNNFKLTRNPFKSSKNISTSQQLESDDCSDNCQIPDLSQSQDKLSDDENEIEFMGHLGSVTGRNIQSRTLGSLENITRPVKKRRVQQRGKTTQDKKQQSIKDMFKRMNSN